MDSSNGFGESLWEALAGEYQVSAPLKGTKYADVAIIGGGLTGVWSAYNIALIYPQWRIILLEARSLGAGASGRSGGLMLNGLPVSVPGLELEARIHKITRACIDEVLGIIQAKALKVGYLKGGTLALITTQREAENAHRYVEAMRALGVTLGFLSLMEIRRGLNIEGACGAIYDPTTLSINSLELTREMKKVLLGMGVEVYENSRVLEIRPGNILEIGLSQGLVRAKRAVLALNAFSPTLGFFQRELLCILHHVVATSPFEKWELQDMGWTRWPGFYDDKRPMSYGTLTKEGCIVFGGGSVASVDYHYGNSLKNSLSPRKREKILKETRKASMRYFSQKILSRDFQHLWTGPIAITRDRFPIIGTMGEERNLYFGVGFNGHGLTLTYLAGKVIADLICGNGSKWEGMPFTYPRAIKFPKEPFKWLGFHTYWRMLKRLPPLVKV